MIRVLVADDHPVMRLGLQLMIESAPDLVHCGSAANGVAAVSLAQQTAPDVVVLDVRMPGGDGIQATRRIRELLPDTGVVIHTSLASAERGAQAAGADIFVLKGATPQTLIEHIRSADTTRRATSKRTSRAEGHARTRS